MITMDIPIPSVSMSVSDGGSDNDATTPAATPKYESQQKNDEELKQMINTAKPISSIPETESSEFKHENNEFVLLDDEKEVEENKMDPDDIHDDDDEEMDYNSIAKKYNFPIVDHL